MNFLRFAKKSLWIIVGLLIMPIVTNAKVFYDVPNNHIYHESITELSEIGMLEGYEGGLFKPEKTIRRQEAVKLIVLGTQPESMVTSTENNLYNGFVSSPFPDVTNSEWAAPFITLGYQQGIIQGYPNGTFQPTKYINFAEGLKIILEAYNVNLYQYSYQNITLIDMKSDDWYAPYFTYAYQANLINKEKYYHPRKKMTRGEFSEIIYRLKTIQDNNINTYQGIRQPSSNQYTITIPKLDIIDLNVSFADLYDSVQALEVLKNGLGHYLATPDSGEKMVLFGHSSGYNWDSSAYKQVLRQINKLQNGDRIYINYREKGYAYEISTSEIIPAPELNKIINNNNHSEKLALYTCWPPDSVSHRYIIYANQING